MRRLAPSDAERVAAEAWEAGAVGLEEGEDRDGTWLLLFAPRECADAVRAAVRACAPSDAQVGRPEPLPRVDWSEAWKEGLAPVVISPRLVVRPPFVAAERPPGQREVVIDPGLAFGTGGHASTRLALVALDAERRRLRADARVLDVGTGSGVLALAALALGAGRAVAFDLDPLATRAARDAARENRLADRLLVYTGPIDALAGPPFDVVVANLLRSELLPVLAHVAARTASGGVCVLSGLLAAERDVVAAAAERAGLRVVADRDERDAAGDHWLALTTTR